MLKFKKRDNVIEATFHLIKVLRTRITYSSLKQSLKNHPDYPSLYAISDVLNSYKIQSMAININAEDLINVPMPCFAPMNTDEDLFAVINSVQDGVVEWFQSNKGYQKDFISAFAENWKGVLLLVEATELSGEKNYNVNRKKEILTQVGQNMITFGTILASVIVLYLLLFSNTYSFLSLTGLTQ